jgi:hypothetical protein
MVKKKSSSKKRSSSVKKVVEDDLHSCYFDMESSVNWGKIAVTIVIGALLGFYFAGSAITLQTVLLFIVIILVVLVLTLLLDIRRYIVGIIK